MPRPRFSLLFLVLASLCCAATMLLYVRWEPWVCINPPNERNSTPGSAPGMTFYDRDFRTAFQFVVWTDPPQNLESLFEPRENHAENFVWISKDNRTLVRALGMAGPFGLILKTAEVWDIPSRKKLHDLDASDWSSFDVWLDASRRYLKVDTHSGRRFIELKTGAAAETSPVAWAALRSPTQEINDEVRASLDAERKEKWKSVQSLPALELLARGNDELGFVSIYYGILFSNDGRFIVTHGGETGLRWTVWDGATLQRLRDIPISAGDHKNAAFTPGGDHLVVATDQNIRIFNTTSGAIVFECVSGADEVFGFLEDEQHLLRYATNTREYSLTNWRTGEIYFKREITIESWPPNPRILSTTRYADGLEIRRIADSELLYRFPFKSEDCLIDFSPDRNHAATRNEHGVLFWKKTREEGLAGLLKCWEPYLVLLLLGAAIWSAFRR